MAAGQTEPCRPRNSLSVERHFDNSKYSEVVIWASRRMARIQLTELTAFVAVAEHRSFTKAAAQVGIALPTMSQTIRSLEERLGIRLFNRTTRSVALTEAGERLFAEVQPILDGIDHALEGVNSFRDKPIGTLRLSIERSSSEILRSVALAPLILPFLAEYPAIRLEVAIDDEGGDIVGGRFDAGIRVGHRIERDMTILRILDEFRVLAVAAPAYMAARPRPSLPKDLHAHNCIRYRSPSDGSILHWIFSKGGQQTEVAVEGTLIANDIDLMLRSTLDGIGVGFLPEPIVAPYLAQGRLVSLLEGWSRTLPGVFLYHPSRRQTPMPLQVFLRFVEKWRKHAFVADPIIRADGEPLRQHGLEVARNDPNELIRNKATARSRRERPQSANGKNRKAASD
jgi:DNA-binding transcriptional LysR family regulator